MPFGPPIDVESGATAPIIVPEESREVAGNYDPNARHPMAPPWKHAGIDYSAYRQDQPLAPIPIRPDIAAPLAPVGLPISEDTAEALKVAGAAVSKAQSKLTADRAKVADILHRAERGEDINQQELSLARSTADLSERRIVHLREELEAANGTHRVAVADLLADSVTAELPHLERAIHDARKALVDVVAEYEAAIYAHDSRIRQLNVANTMVGITDRIQRDGAFARVDGKRLDFLRDEAIVELARLIHPTFDKSDSYSAMGLNLKGVAGLQGLPPQ